MFIEFFRECVYIMHIKHLNSKDMGKGMLVLEIAKEYQNRGLTLDELVEAGFDGLKKAAKKFHEKDKPDCKFESYAVWWIRQSIIQAIEDKK